MSNRLPVLAWNRALLVGVGGGLGSTRQARSFCGGARSARR
jgi:hypothetical protein